MVDYLCYMNYLEALAWRYSVKKFSGEKIDSQSLQNILEAGRLSVSSLGLQPYKLIVVESDAQKEKIMPAFYNKSQVSTCSHVVAIVSKTKIDSQYVDGYFSHISKERNIELEILAAFRKNIEQYTSSHTESDLRHWSEKQAYILLGTMIVAAAEEGVDTCPMEGFQHDVLSELLELNMDEERVAVVLTLGKRADDDGFQHLKKVRKPVEKFIKFI
ncbi:NAD(P)H-dependent oxidoreductase [Soonwooa sp.]|uniref:NAD(P)H-dependent oxidoreductase n=1 Tax=Soonwooa sp. TaxID=1938592 RepID=UPI0028AAA5F3|nr:NAD(P)H-dependent oxidoreductase [Soonwooa sp.]